MHRETLLLIALQSGALFVALWGIFRLVPSIPANAKAWMWRLAFLKPLLSLLPFATVSLPLLQAPDFRPQTSAEPVLEQPVWVLEAAQPLKPEVLSPKPDLDPLLALWLVGVAGVSIHALVGMRRALKVVKQAEPVRSVEINRAYWDLLDKSGVRRRPALLQSENVASAMLIGGRRYAIVLPAHTVQGEFEDVRLMLAHEVAHIARHDLIWFGLASAAQSLFFFNPMVWVAARCSRLDHESATDLHASRLAGVPIQRYADMLLRATVVARPSYAPGTLPVAESYRSIHRRLEAMKHFNSKPTLLRRTATAALALLTLSLIPAYEVVAAGAPKMQEPPQPQPPVVAKPAQKKAAAPKKTTPQKEATKWYITTEGGRIVPATGKPGMYKIYQRKAGKWILLKPGTKFDKPAKGKAAKTVYRIVVDPAAVQAKPAQPGKPVKGKTVRIVNVQGAPGTPPAIIAAPSRPGAPAGMPPLAAPGRPGAPTTQPPLAAPSRPGAPTALPPQGVTISQPAQGQPVTVQGQQVITARGGSYTIFPAKVQGQVVTTQRGVTIIDPSKVPAGQVITTQGGKYTIFPAKVQGQAVTTTQGGVTIIDPSKVPAGQAIKVEGGKVTFVPLTTLQGQTVNVQSVKGLLTYPTAVRGVQGGKLTTVNGAYVNARGLTILSPSQVKGYRGVTNLATPYKVVRGKDGNYILTPTKVNGKLYRVYNSKKKGAKSEKAPAENHHGATDPTYTGYSGM